MRRRRCAYRTDCTVKNRILAGAARAKRSALIQEVGSGREGPRGLLHTIVVRNPAVGIQALGINPMFP